MGGLAFYLMVDIRNDVSKLDQCLIRLYTFRHLISGYPGRFNNWWLVYVGCTIRMLLWHHHSRNSEVCLTSGFIWDPTEIWGPKGTIGFHDPQSLGGEKTQWRVTDPNQYQSPPWRSSKILIPEPFKNALGQEGIPKGQRHWRPGFYFGNQRF